MEYKFKNSVRRERTYNVNITFQAHAMTLHTYSTQPIYTPVNIVLLIMLLVTVSQVTPVHRIEPLHTKFKIHHSLHMQGHGEQKNCFSCPASQLQKQECSSPTLIGKENIFTMAASK